MSVVDHDFFISSSSSMGKITSTFNENKKIYNSMWVNGKMMIRGGDIGRGGLESTNVYDCEWKSVLAFKYFDLSD